MPDSVYDLFMKDCIEERASLIGLIEAIETKMLAPGMQIAIPQEISGKLASTLESFKQTVLQLNVLIAHYKATPKTPEGPD